MKRTISLLLSFWVLVSVTSVQAQQVYGTDTFSIREGSREHDYFGRSGERVRLVSFDIGSRKIFTGQVSLEDGWLELDTLIVEFIRYHNPVGTLEVSPTVATVADITDIRMEDTQGEVVAIGKWKTVLPMSWVEEVSPPGSMNQMVFEAVQPAKRFRGGTFFISVVPSQAFVTDDVVGAGIRKVAIRSKDGVETCEPYPEWGVFISTGTTIINPAVLSVSVLPSTPTSVPASENVAGARFEVKAKSVRPRSPMLWRGWQLEFAVPRGTALDLGIVKVLNPAGEVIKEETPILKGNNPRLGLLSFTVPDAGRTSGYSLKSEETLTVTFSTKAFAGADITITSVALLASDFGGTNPQYGDLVFSNKRVFTTVHVQDLPPDQPTVPGGSGNTGGGGGVIVPSEPPVIADELPVPEIESIGYWGGDSLWCLVVFKTAVPVGVNRVQWSVPNAHVFVDELFWAPERNGVAFRLLALPEEFRQKELTELRGLFQDTPVGIRFFNLHR